MKVHQILVNEMTILIVVTLFKVEPMCHYFLIARIISFVITFKIISLECRETIYLRN